VATPDTLRADAARLRREADAITVALAGVRRHSGPDVWGGPLADRVVAALADHERSLAAAAGDLHRVAATLQARADVIEAQLLREAAQRRGPGALA
jgi:hypothetical protein